MDDFEYEKNKQKKPEEIKKFGWSEPIFVGIILLCLICEFELLSKSNEKTDSNNSNRLEVSGMLRRGVKRYFDISDIRRMRGFTLTASDPFTLNNGGGNVTFRGVDLKDLLAEAQPATQTPKIVLVGGDDYHAVVRKEDFLKYKIMICFEENGASLNMHKGPLRVVVDAETEDFNERKRLYAFWVCGLKRILIGEQPSDNRTKLIVWTSIPGFITAQIEGDFEQRFPEIDLNIEIKKAAYLHNQVLAWIASGTPMPADAILFSEPSDAERLKFAGFLRRYYPKDCEKIPLIYRDPDGYYTGVRIVNIGLACNANYPPPKDLNELLDGDYKQKIGWVRSKHVGVYLLASIVNQDELGWTFIRKFLENTERENIFDSYGDSTEQVALGKLRASFSLDYLAYNLLKANPGLPLIFTQPMNCRISICSPIVIASNTAKPREIEILVDDLVSQSFQAFLAKVGIAPIRSDIPIEEVTKAVWNTAGGTYAGLREESLTGISPAAVDHRYIAANSEGLRKNFEEIESLVYEEK